MTNGADLDLLAIHGGKPVRPRLLPYGHQLIDDADIAAVADVLRSDWLTTGPRVTEFEAAFALAVGAADAVAVSNGTAALHSAVWAAGIGPGDEVVVPALTFVASANCVRYVGGTVVFADVRPDTLCLDPVSVAARITPRTRAIISVDFAGQPCDMDELLALARANGLVVIEDAAHAIGAAYRGRRVGTIADLTTFSLHPVKQMTTGEGGMVATSDPDLARRLRLFRGHGITTDARQREAQGSWFYEMHELGWNYRLTDLQCALGLAQLRKVPAWLVRRKAIAAIYDQALESVAEVDGPTVLPDRESGWHLYVIQLRLDRLSVDRATVFAALRAENIGVNVHYIPVPWHPYYRGLGYAPGQWPRTEAAYERLLTLPLWAGMTDDDVADVVRAVTKVCSALRR